MSGSDLPAIAGGTPLLPEGPLAWPLYDEEVIAAGAAALADGTWGQYHGPHVERLSQRLCEHFQTQFASPCCSGTVAVELALRGLGVEAVDEVILAAYDFPGNFRAIEAIGARPVLVDTLPGSWSFDPETIAAAAGPQVKAVLVSHLHGEVVPMPRIMELARAHNLAVVEDAAQSPGAIIAGKPAGSWGDAGILSFGGSKLLTAGRGGAVLTSRPEVAQRIKVFRDRGNDAYPLSELQAAVLIPQLAKLGERNAQRQQAVNYLREKLSDVPALRFASPPPTDWQSAYYKLGLWLNPDLLGNATRETFSAAVRLEGVPLDPAFRGFALRTSRRCRFIGDLAHARLAAAQTLVLHHPLLLSEDSILDRVAKSITRVVLHFREVARATP